MDRRRALLAFSGGLDTSYCVLYLRERGYEVTTLTGDVGGMDEAGRERLRRRALDCGAVDHVHVDLRGELCKQVLTPLIRSGYLKGGNYPFCVGAERGLQASAVAHHALENGFQAVAHGSTGAGNDQVRFDVTFRTLLPPDIEIITPIRDHAMSRQETTDKLVAAGIPVEAKTTLYSVNASLWGTTLGGGPVHDPAQDIPEDLRHTVRRASEVEGARDVTLGFSAGLPVSVDGQPMAMPELIEALNEIGAAQGVGRDVHTGDTVLGIKGRIVFEAPGAHLIHIAHRELCKLILGKWQLLTRESLASTYGTLLHEGLHTDPVMRDIEAYFAREQSLVEGEVTLRLGAGTTELLRLDSPNSRMKGKAQYGEETHGWSGRDAQGFGQILSLSQRRPD